MNINYTDSSKVLVSSERMQNEPFQNDPFCIEAEYVITTFNVAVLQAGVIGFDPPLPQWKKTAIDTMQMGVYTKIFMRFPCDQVFWNRSTETFLHVSPKRGYYPVFQNLDHENFHLGSGILFVTMVGDEAYRIDRQTNEQTEKEVMEVLHDMFGTMIPDPIAFYYPGWTRTEWAYGSFSNMPAGMTLENHQNLRANVDRVWFAGKATSTNYFGFLQCAYFERKEIGDRIAAKLNEDYVKGADLVRYED
jgi:polyamine oxidase